MVKQVKSQGEGNESVEEEGNYLFELLEKAREKHGVNSWEEFAALITLRSGDQVSGNTFRRNLRKGKNAWKMLSLSLLQWVAISEVTGVTMSELVKKFKKENQTSDQN